MPKGSFEAQSKEVIEDTDYDLVGDVVYVRCPSFSFIYV
jgi:hypothetical protein